MDPIFRHVRACNNAALPGGRTPVLLDGQSIGWLDPALLAPLARLGHTPGPNGLSFDLTGLQTAAVAMAEAGLYRQRAEPFDIRATPDGPVLGTIDRGALPGFGIRAVGVHLNGLVDRADGLHLWVARRAASKRLDPGKLDHLVAGGVPAGLTLWEGLLKEAGEEAALPASLLADATETCIIDYAMARPEGLRRDRLHCYDVTLPETFTPEATDGEVESFALWPLAQALDRVRDTDDFKFNVNLVLIDLFQRHGLLGPTPGP